jgi:hypothetical protein
MIKILMGLAAAIIVAAGGFLGFGFYTQHRIAGEIDAAFEQIRATGGKASHGKISFDLWSRTFEIADIAAETATQPPLNVKIAGLKAMGVRQPDATRFAADTIEATGVDVDASLTAPTGLRMTYKLLQVAVKDYSGPATLQRSAVSASLIDNYRLALQQFAGVTASSVTAPDLVMTIDVSGLVSGGQYTYSGLSLQGIKGGKIATMKVDRMAFAAEMNQAGKPSKLTGNFANLTALDFDTTALATILDPQKASDDNFYTAYRQITASDYSFATDPGLRMHMDGMEIDDVAFRPSRFQIPALIAMIPPAGSVPTPAQSRAMMEKMAGLYEGMRIGKGEMRGLAAETPQGPLKLAAIRMNLDNGKIGEFAVEGLDAKSQKGPVTIGRFALKSLDVAGLLRTTAQFAAPGQKPSPDQIAGLLALLGGVEVKGLAAPFKNTGKPVTLDDFSLNWSQFVGPIPSQLRLTAKMATPVDAGDATAKPLVALGLQTIAADCDVSAAWTEAAQTFVLDAPTLGIDGMLKASARVSLGNVPRQVFTLNPQQAAMAATQIESGTIEVTLRDAGGVDLLVAAYARIQNVSADAARQAIVDTIKSHSENITTADPDAAAVVDALVHLFQNPKTALTVKLAPRGKIRAMPLVQALQTDPAATLALFQIDVSTMQ